jgi:Amt family ammonium transporter
VRVGIHTGPAVAGVIGKKKFIYDVWGDTVNTASRMESHGSPGRVHVTDETKRVLERDFELEERGEIEVKGKGKMKTWFVKGPRA